MAIRTTAATLGTLAVALLGGCATHRPLLGVDGLPFRDLNGNGRLDAYEDWRLSSARLAAENNRLQEIAESTRLGIPLTISTDPRHHSQFTAGAVVSPSGFSQWPEMLGMPGSLAAGGSRHGAALAARDGDIRHRRRGAARRSRAQKSDVPSDSAAPPYRIGYGLTLH
jgi:hypothetical protein